MQHDETPASLTLGVPFGAYVARRVLGVGPFGTTYEALRRSDQRPVALKALHPHVYADRVAVGRFEAEQRAAARVQHPHLVAPYERGTHGDVPFVASALLPGESLREVLVRMRTIPLQAAVGVALPVLSALSAAHAQGVTHRDVKPENIFLHAAPDGARAPRLLDLGVAALRDAAPAPLARRLLETAPQYLAPEQVRLGAADAATDVWAIGAVLFECVTGRGPFVGAEVSDVLGAIEAGTFPAPSRLNSKLPAAFDAVVRRALSPAGSARYAGAMDLARALLPFAHDATRAAWAQLAGTAALAAPPAPPPSTSHELAPTPPRRAPAPRVLDDPRQYLQRVEAFARLPYDDASALLSFVRWRALAQDEVLYRKGAPGATMVFVVEGELSVVDDGAPGEEIARVGAGFFVGEMACLDPSPRSATVTAAAPCVVGELSRDGLRTLQAVAPRAAAAVVGTVIRGVVTRLRDVEARIDEAVRAPDAAPAREGQAAAQGGMARLVEWLRRR